MYVNHVPLRTVYHLCPSANCWQLLPIIASYLVDEQNVGLTDKCPTCQQHQLEHVGGGTHAAVRPQLDRVAQALLQKETLSSSELREVLDSVPSESRSADTVGTVKLVPKA
jgi:hypothetical protein